MTDFCSHCCGKIDLVAKDSEGKPYCAYCGRPLNDFRTKIEEAIKEIIQRYPKDREKIEKEVKKEFRKYGLEVEKLDIKVNDDKSC